MSRRRHTPEQIITALREAEVGLARGKTVAMVSRELGISEQTYYRWRKEGIVKLRKICVIDLQDIVVDALRGPRCWVSELA